MNNFPAMTEERRQELIAECEEEIAHLKEMMRGKFPMYSEEVYRSKVERQQIALAALTRDNAKLAREIVYRLVDVGEADPDVVDSYQVWVLRKLNGVKS